MIRLGRGSNMTEAERADAAMLIWNEEKGLAAMAIVAGWLCKACILLRCVPVSAPFDQAC